MGGNIHTTLDDDEVNWDFDVHPDILIISYTKCNKNDKPKPMKMDFTNRVNALRKDIIDAIQQLLYSQGLTEITFPEEQDDPVWVIWFNWDGAPHECKVTGVKVTDNGSIHIYSLNVTYPLTKYIFLQEYPDCFPTDKTHRL